MYDERRKRDFFRELQEGKKDGKGTRKGPKERGKKAIEGTRKSTKERRKREKT